MNGRLAAFGRFFPYSTAKISSTSKFARQISVGFTAECTKTFSEDEIRQYSLISCDDNPLHLSKDYARGTRFGRPIVHGTLVLRSVINAWIYKYIGYASLCLLYHCLHWVMFSACFLACCTSILEEREASLSPLLPSSQHLVSWKKYTERGQ